MDFELRMVVFQIVAPIMSVAVMAPIVLYIVARWRAYKDPIADPQLGLKFAIYYFATAALHLGLVGGTLLLYTMIKPGEGESKGDMYRLAFGFIVPAGIVFGVQIPLLFRTNDGQFPAVRRLFIGFNLLVTGVIGFAALVLGAQALFMKGSSQGMGHLGGAAIVVYCSVWALLAWQFDFVTIGRNRFMGGPPGNVVPPAAPPPPPPAAAQGGGGGLPPLGGGSYPPIDR
jgi:hypothetical protein